MDAGGHKTLYAASYQRRRTSWGFNGGGPGSGIWKTTDAGKTWTKLEGSGLPEGLLGRIGLDVVALESERRLCADRGRRERAARAAVKSKLAAQAVAAGRWRRRQAAGGRRRRPGRPGRPGTQGRFTGSRPEAERRLALGRQGQDLALHEQQQQPPDVLQPDSRRSEE